MQRLCSEMSREICNSFVKKKVRAGYLHVGRNICLLSKHKFPRASPDLVYFGSSRGDFHRSSDTIGVISPFTTPPLYDPDD